MKQFKTGTIVKSINRTEEWPLFVMVIRDPYPSPDQFNGVILLDASHEGDDEGSEPGRVSNSWNTPMFVECGWADLIQFKTQI